MTVSGQRVWRRVEAPQTHRGHALRGLAGGVEWTSWENPNGTWTLQRSDDPSTQQSFHNWSEARRAAEYGGRLPNPMPLNPLLASAALTGVNMAIRNAFAPNPAERTPYQAAVARSATVFRAIPPEWVTCAPVLTREGTLVVRVLPGHGTPTLERLGAADVEFPVEVVEGHVPRLPNPGPPRGLVEVLAILRAASLIHRNAHWQVSGEGAYGLHLLFERIYTASNENTDTWAEQMVGSYGPASVGLEGLQLEVMVEAIRRFEEPTNPLHRSFSALLELRKHLGLAYDAAKAADALTLGWDDMIMSLSRRNDQHLYLVQQALGGPVPAA